MPVGIVFRIVLYNKKYVHWDFFHAVKDINPHHSNPTMECILHDLALYLNEISRIYDIVVIPAAKINVKLDENSNI